MYYSAAMTSTGQVTLPKELRVFLGVDGAKRITFVKKKDEVVVRRKMTKEEYYADMRRHMSAKTRKILEEEEKNGGRPPVREMMAEIYRSPEMHERWRRKLGE